MVGTDLLNFGLTHSASSSPDIRDGLGRQTCSYESC